MSERLITKLTVRGCNLNNIPGGINAITEYDVASALSFGSLPEPAYYLARAKYLQDMQASVWMMDHFVVLVKQEMASRSLSEKCGRAKSVAQLILTEGVMGRSCKKCNGDGRLQPTSSETTEVAICDKCEGSGLGFLSEYKRSQLAEIPYTSWNRQWKTWFKEFFFYLNELEIQVVRHVKRQVYGEGEEG